MCVLGRSQHGAPAGSDGLAALNHLQPTGEIPLSQPGAGSGECPPPGSRVLGLVSAVT